MRKLCVIHFFLLLLLLPGVVIAEATGTTQSGWLFNSSLEGWFAVNFDNQMLDTGNGWWVIDPGSDVRLVSPFLTRSPSSVNYVKFRMKNKGGPDTRGRFYYSKDGGSMSETNSKGFTLENDFEWKWISLRLDDIPGWGGSNIDQIRIDPVMYGCSPEPSCMDDILFDAVFLRLDETPPVLTGEAVSPSGWTNQNSFTFTWNEATDGPDDGTHTGYGSGVDHYEVKRGSGDWQWNALLTYKSWTAYQQGENTFKVRALDVCGKRSDEKPVTYKYDSTNPSNPTSASSSSHSTGTWSSDNTVQISWSGASDAHSGIKGYSWSWTTSSTTVPDNTRDGTGTSTTSSALSSGSNWYFHVRSQDNVGNWASGAKHHGPFKIDTTAPSNPTSVSSSSHSLSTPSFDNTVEVTWSGAADAHSGIKGYSWSWTTSSTTVPDNTRDGTGTSTTSPPLAVGSHYFHVRSQDNVGIWASGAKHYGPFVIIDSGPASQLTCPGNVVIPAGSIIDSLNLSGFKIKNVSSDNISFDYYLSAEGPAILSDNGDPEALSGTTPVLAPGGSFSPPEAGLLIPVIRELLEEVITYHVSAVEYPNLLDSCKTTVTFEPPIAVLIEGFDAQPIEGGVEISWLVTADENIKGFRIYRESEDQSIMEPLPAEGLMPPEVRKHIDRDVPGGRSYRYMLCVVCEDGSEFSSQLVTVQTPVAKLALYQNHPNPFNPSTTIAFSLPKRMHVTLTIYNFEGKLVRTLVNGYFSEGFETVTWDGKNEKGNPVGSGVYFYRLKTGEKALTRKMVLVR